MGSFTFGSWVVLSLAAVHTATGQSSLNRFLTPADSFSKSRTAGIAAGWTALYAGSFMALNEAWYSEQEKTNFHFFKDWNEWMGMDKAGHIYAAWFQSVWTTSALQWAGNTEIKSACYGAATGFLFQTTIELFDGFQEDYGASAGDIAANAVGSAVSLSQFLLWHDQRIQIKFSAHMEDHPDDLQPRADEIFGTSFPEKILKDYNGQTYWLSVNPSSFCLKEKTRFPRWLNVAVGYGADGMYAGFENVWEENGETVNRTDVPRTGAFYLAPDLDLTRIRTHSAVLKTLFEVLNVIKVPAPTLQVGTDGKVKVYAAYF